MKRLIFLLILIPSIIFSQEEKPFHFIGITPSLHSGYSTRYHFTGKQSPELYEVADGGITAGYGLSISYYNKYLKSSIDYVRNPGVHHHQYCINAGVNLMGAFQYPNSMFYLGPEYRFEMVTHKEPNVYRSFNSAIGFELNVKGFSAHYSWRINSDNPGDLEPPISHYSGTKSRYWVLSLGYTFRLHTLGKAKQIE